MTKKRAPREKVTLKKSHTHGGKDYKPGDTIDVCLGDKAWLKKHGVIE